MIPSKNAESNTVSALGQIDVNKFVSIFKRGGAKRVLFFGNSITRHEPNPSLGWYGDWGMAASREENDYVHTLVSMLQAAGDNVDYCIAQLAEWERDYERGLDILNEKYAREIAEKWNKKSADSGYAGYVTTFEIDDAYISRFDIQTVGASYHQEYWIPAEDLMEFNRHIIGKIEVL